MKKSNLGAIVFVFIIIGVIRIIGIENIPFPVIVIVLILCMVGAFLIALKYKGNKTERMYLLVITTLRGLCSNGTENHYLISFISIYTANTC